MLSQTGQELYKAYIEKILSQTQLNNLKNYYARLLRLEMRMVEKSPHTPPQSNKVRRLTPISFVSFFPALIYYLKKKI